jgi:hypothetical protein
VETPDPVTAPGAAGSDPLAPAAATTSPDDEQKKMDELFKGK